MLPSGTVPDRAAEVVDGPAAMAYAAVQFRPYQERALEAFERQRAAGDRRFYLTMPPGSGKTAAIGAGDRPLDLGRPTMVLGPNAGGAGPMAPGMGCI